VSGHVLPPLPGVHSTETNTSAVVFVDAVAFSRRERRDVARHAPPPPNQRRRRTAVGRHRPGPPAIRRQPDGPDGSRFIRTAPTDRLRSSDRPFSLPRRHDGDSVDVRDQFRRLIVWPGRSARLGTSPDGRAVQTSRSAGDGRTWHRTGTARRPSGRWPIRSTGPIGHRQSGHTVGGHGCVRARRANLPRQPRQQ